VKYYFMPVSQLRGADVEADVSNFRSCIGFWDAVMGDLGVADEWSQQANYVLAVAYALIHRDKGSQRIYRDALLRPRSFSPEDLCLSPEVQVQIEQAVASRNRDAIQRQLDVALESAQLSDEDRIATCRAMDQWVNRGVARLRADGRDGLRAWLAEVDEWLTRFRKRSKGRLRTFLDVFATECKLSFYLCYSNFWIGLLHWLEENQFLDPMSKRFLSIWHHQNRNVEVIHGRTTSGIIYPTSAGRSILLRDDSGSSRWHTFTWQTEHIGPEVVPDVFRAQILALHPLNWILLSRVELREKIGRCISSPQFDVAMRTGRVAHFPAYWEMLESIVTAAHLYRHARLHNEARRTIRRPRRRSAMVEASTDLAIPPVMLLREFVDSLRRVCRCGGGTYRYTAADPPAGDRKVVMLQVTCCRCGSQAEIKVTRQELERYLSGDC
jgi:hypothetical protein